MDRMSYIASIKYDLIKRKIMLQPIIYCEELFNTLYPVALHISKVTQAIDGQY